MRYEPGILTNTIGWVARYRYHYVITPEGAEKSAPFFAVDVEDAIPCEKYIFLLTTAVICDIPITDEQVLICTEK